MEYSINYNGSEYTLPRKTLKVMEKLEEVIKIDSKPIGIKEKFKKVYGFLTDLLGAEATKQILGADKLEEVDLGELTLVIKMIMDAYDKPITDYDVNKATDLLDALPIEKISELARTTQEAKR